MQWLRNEVKMPHPQSVRGREHLSDTKLDGIVQMKTHFIDVDFHFIFSKAIVSVLLSLRGLEIQKEVSQSGYTLFRAFVYKTVCALATVYKAFQSENSHV